MQQCTGGCSCMDKPLSCMENKPLSQQYDIVPEPSSYPPSGNCKRSITSNQVDKIPADFPGAAEGEKVPLDCLGAAGEPIPNERQQIDVAFLSEQVESVRESETAAERLQHSHVKSQTAEWLIDANSKKNEYIRLHTADFEGGKLVTISDKDLTSWFHTLCILRGRPPLGSIFWFVQGCTVAFVVACKIYDVEYDYAPDGHKLIGVIVTFLVVLRTVDGLRKYWESVRAWTKLAAVCTDCAQQCTTILQDHHLKIQSLKYVITFCRTVRSHLRKETVTAAEVSGILNDQELIKMNSERSPPLYCLLLIRRCLAQAVEKKQAIGMGMVIEKSMYNMMRVFADCEKLMHPMPIVLVLHLRTFILLYLLTLVPIIYPQFGWSTIFVSAAGTYALIGLETSATMMSHPFGYDSNCVPIDHLCVEIQQQIMDLIHDNEAMNDMES